MALNQLADSRDIRFVLFEMLEVEKLNHYGLYADFDRDVFEETLELAEKIAVKELAPQNAEGDRIGCQYNPETKEVKAPPGFKQAYNVLLKTGLNSVMTPAEYGGMGMPPVIGMATLEYLTAGCMSLMMYPGLTLASSHLIMEFGSEEIKKLYLENMTSGKWGGTMCLTEADAGSDVGNIKTKAIPQDNGTYHVTGTKIFISSGESDIVENTIHFVLARIEGDPPGTGGISLFLIPKYLANPDGTIGERNDVYCSGIEHKIGIKGSVTSTLSFGDNGSCVGYLLGEARTGMGKMFQMMNEARLGTGIQALSLSSTAYMHAATYAKNRIQGTEVIQMLNPDAPRVSIIKHHDVRRMLLWMKSYVEGMRMLTYYLGHNTGNYMLLLDGEEKKEIAALCEFLLPVLKAGHSDMSWLITSEAMQVYGGYGFCSDFPVEQFARDSKILSLYEGTNGIQALDLTMRKLLLNENQYMYSIFVKQVKDTTNKSRGIVDDKYINPIESGIIKLDEIVEKFKNQFKGGKVENVLMNCVPFLKCLHMLVLGWLHLWSLNITISKVNEIIGDISEEEKQKIIEDNNEAAYYYGRVLSAKFFIGAEFPKYFGMIDCILEDEESVLDSNSFTFTGMMNE